jgi:hypothetical protein
MAARASTQRRSARRQGGPVPSIPGALAVALIGIGALGAACSSGGDDDGATDEPSCNEERLATGKGYAWDPGLALVVARQIEVAHPEISGIVDAAAAYQEANPTYQDFENHRRGDVTGDGTTAFLASLLVLADRADLGTPETLEALERAATEGGILEVSNTVVSSSPTEPLPYSSPAFLQLRNLVYERREHVEEDAGIASLPDPRCPPERRDE